VNLNTAAPLRILAATSPPSHAANPFALHAHGRVIDGAFRIDFRNDGAAGAVFEVSGASNEVPRSYTVEGGGSLLDSWYGTPGTGQYDLSVRGPSGFYRRFRGTLAGPNSRVMEVRAAYDARHSNVLLELSNPTAHEAIVKILDRYTSKTIIFVIDPGELESRRWGAHRTGGWYDLTVSVEGNPAFATQFAGHLENVENRISDPLREGLL